MVPRLRRAPRRAARLLFVGLVAGAHVAAFLAASLSLQTPPAPAEPPPHAFATLPLAQPEPSRRLFPSARPHTARGKRERVKGPVFAAAPAAPGVPPAAPGRTPPAASLRGPAGEMADPYAVREALRGSVGCDLENLKLRPDEQARCADRTVRWARKGRRIGPDADDPKRAAELAAEEDFLRRKLDWKTSNCGIGNANDELDEKGTLGQIHPRRGQSKDDWVAANKDAC